METRATVTVDEAARILGVGRASMYEGVRTGRIPSIRVSERRIVIPRVALERLLNGTASEPPLPPSERKTRKAASA